jgi:uncharacterized protein YjiS (DUF1127 family)
MSTDVFGGRSPTFAGQRRSISLTGLARFVRSRFGGRDTESEVDGLSDRYLMDIGVDRRQVSDRAEREIMQSRLLDMGWRSSPRR